MKFTFLNYIFIIFLLSGCSGLKELKSALIGADLSSIDNIKTAEDDKIKSPLPETIIEQPNRNSLWQPGARSFFKDQRACRPGDILTVQLNINDSATINNETKTDRKSNNVINLNNVLGLETNGFTKFFPNMTPATAVNTSSEPQHDGNGSIIRSEQISLEIAAMVIKLLPNGNLVIKGEQEIMVNNELRRLFVSGIVSKSDIAPGNIVDSSRISQARILYGGEGEISDIQQDKWGNKLVNTIIPF